MRLSYYLPLKCGNKSCPASKCLEEEPTHLCGSDQKTYHFSSKAKSWSFILDSKERWSGGNNERNKVFAGRRQNEKDRFRPHCLCPVCVCWRECCARTVRKIYRALIHQLQRPFFGWKLRILIKTTVKSFCEWTQGRKGWKTRSGRNNEISVVKDFLL